MTTANRLIVTLAGAFAIGALAAPAHAMDEPWHNARHAGHAHVGYLSHGWVTERPHLRWETRVSQAPGASPLGSLPEGAGLAKSAAMDLKAMTKQASCTSANATTPDCYTATQQGKVMATRRRLVHGAT